jgi:glycosyltransferase involved in cell wall biosynthesis
MRVALHATNVRGLGATNLVNSLLGPLVNALSGNNVMLCLEEGAVVRPDISGIPNLEIIRTRRQLPRKISRLFEIMFPGERLPKADRYLILGDVPLKSVPGQYVLVHQSHLMAPSVEPHAEKSLRYRTMRYLFRKNCRFVECFLVQTDVVKNALMRSYGISESRIKVVPHPAPDWAKSSVGKEKTGGNGRLTLFYPAAAHLHKNHRILGGMEQFRDVSDREFRVIVTLRPFEITPELKRLGWVEPIGRLSPEGCLEQYRKSHALFFPSVLESFPLPLAEAMSLGLPVVCSDLPYARWVCEEQAIYFDPHDAASACRAIKELTDRLARGWKPDWRKALSKIPGDWDDAGKRFASILVGRATV